MQHIFIPSEYLFEYFVRLALYTLNRLYFSDFCFYKQNRNISLLIGFHILKAQSFGNETEFNDFNL